VTAPVNESILTFLRGSKLGERCPDFLYIPTNIDGVDWALEDALLRALAGGRDVVVAGSAGGGKTSLIDAMQRRAVDLGLDLRFRAGNSTASDDSAGDMASSVMVLSDLTEIPSSDRQDLIQRLRGSGQLLMAANEGAISEAAFEAPLGSVLDHLHSMQNASHICDDTRPVVVDLAGISSLGDRLASILVHPMIRDAVAFFEDSHGCGDAETCGRFDALATLDERMARAVAKLAETALGPREVTFRQVWEFVEDILLGGRCDGIAPKDWYSSAWFWRVFYGDSLISKEISARFAPERLAFPVLEDDLYYGDWEAIANHTGERVVLPPTPPVRSDVPSVTMQWLKAQAFFLDSLHSANLDRNVEYQSGVMADLQESRTDSIVQLLNAYFRGRSPRSSDSIGLELWGGLGIQRRTERDRGLVRFALVPPEHLAITKSMVVGNLDGVDIRGTRQFLTVGSGEDDRNAVLPITARLIEALGRGRSARTSDRANDDVEESYWSFVTRSLDVRGIPVGQELMTARPRNSESLGIVRSWRVAGPDLVLTAEDVL
jgi:hypothetical protein